jgi:hypothetical protein
LIVPRLNGLNTGGYDTINSVIEFPSGDITPILSPDNIKFGNNLVSPNGQWIGYEKSIYASDHHVESTWFIIENLKREKVAQFREEKTSDYYVASWLDNERLVVSDEGVPYIINAFNGEKVPMPEGYANVIKDMNFDYYGDLKGVLNSNIDRIFYTDNDTSLVLYDLTNHKIIYKLTLSMPYGALQTPLWTNDGGQILFANNINNNRNSPMELFSLSRDGELIQLTYLNYYYKYSGMDYFSLSPDNKKLAFFFEEFGKEDSHFAILDLETLQVTNYCDLAGRLGASRSPVWSPDSTKLLFDRVESDGHTVHTVLLDLVNNYAAIVAENLSPAVWVKDTPH